MSTGGLMPLIVHIVSWRLHGSSPEERSGHARRIVAAFENARTQVDGLLRLEAGPNLIEAPDAWDLAVVMVFASRAALDAYQTHPSHLAIKALVGPLRSVRGQIDFELAAPAVQGLTPSPNHQSSI